MSLSNHPLDRAVVFAVDFRPRTVGGLSVMPNHGRAAGAPRWLQLGDGVTSTTFPTPLAGYGATFDGGDWVDTGIVDRYERTDQFSLYVFPQYSRYTPDYRCLLGTNNIATNQGWYVLLDTLLPTVYTQMLSTGTSDGITVPGIQQSASLAINFPGTAAASTWQVYSNGRRLTTSVGSDSLNATIKNGKPILIGAAHNGTSKAYAFRGSIYAAGIFDGLLTQRDISILDNLVRQGIK